MKKPVITTGFFYFTFWTIFSTVNLYLPSSTTLITSYCLFCPFCIFVAQNLEFSIKISRLRLDAINRLVIYLQFYFYVHCKLTLFVIASTLFNISSFYVFIVTPHFFVISETTSVIITKKKFHKKFFYCHIQCHINKNAPGWGTFLFMGRVTRFELATFGTTNRRSNQLSYTRHNFCVGYPT